MSCKERHDAAMVRHKRRDKSTKFFVNAVLITTKENFLKMLNEVNKDDSLEIVISDLKAKVKCIGSTIFSKHIHQKKDEQKMLHDRLSKAINEKAKT